MSANALSVMAVIQSGPPLERNTLGDQVYAHIRALLIAGRLAPGDRLSLRQVADVMGVSMMPVREAVSRLVADQAIEVMPNRALRVPVMGRHQFEQLAVIRSEIEGFAAERAAAVRTPAQMTVITTSQQHFDELAQAAEPDLPAVVEANDHGLAPSAANAPPRCWVCGGRPSRGGGVAAPCHLGRGPGWRRAPLCAPVRGEQLQVYVVLWSHLSLHAGVYLQLCGPGTALQLRS